MRWIVLLGLFFCLALTGYPAQPAFSAAEPGKAETDTLLTVSWEQYKQTFVQADGRVIDHNGNVTTSEGQAYAMLRAFWMRDRQTFDNAYRWAKDNLQSPRGDKLFAWKWGQRADKTWGILDRISAADADQDIALALLLAHHVWQDPVYLAEARLILNDMWNKLTLDAPLGRVLLPGDWPRTQPGNQYQVNPSYFAPYAYRAFAEADDNHDWKALIDSSYEILARAMAQAETGLPPDWVEISLDNDNVRLYAEALDPRSDFGYEAIRVFWRVGLDARLNPLEKRAVGLLRARNILPRYWAVRRDVPISLTWDGIVRHPEIQSGALYGAILPGLEAQDPTAAKELAAGKIVPNLKPGGTWNTPKDYYSQNWLWFGLALHQAETDTLVYRPRGSVLARLAQIMQPPR